MFEGYGDRSHGVEVAPWLRRKDRRHRFRHQSSTAHMLAVQPGVDLAAAVPFL
jgi:hypothetical protein